MAAGAAVQQKLPEQDNSGLMELLKLFGGQMGGGTTTSTTSSSPKANSNADALLAQIQGGANPELLQNLATSILDKANQSVAPQVTASIGAGNRAYSDTTLQDAVARARAYATEAVAKANLDFIQDSNRTAASLVGNQLQNNKVTTQATGTSTLGKIGQAGAAVVGGYSLLKKAPKVLEGIKEIFNTDTPGISDSMSLFDTTGIEGINAATSAGDAADAADTFSSTFDTTGLDGLDTASAAGDFSFNGAGSAFNLLSGNNEGGQAGENFVLSQIPGVGPFLALANSFDVPIVSDIVDVGGDIVSDIGDAVGCFITTAVTSQQGKPDNCYELEVLRKFRDDYMMENPQYHRFVQQYYKEAPWIMSKLEDSPQKNNIYKVFYLAFIVPAIAAIENNENEQALEIYVSLFYFAKWLASGLVISNEQGA